MTPPTTNSLTDTWRAPARRAWWIAVVAAAYAIGGHLGLSAGLVEPNVTLLWPPTGIAIAALVRGGPGLWPGVALGSFLLNCWTGMPLPVGVALAAGNTLGPLAAALALRRLGVHPGFERRRDVGWFCIAVTLGLLVPPSLGVTTLALGGLRPWTGSGWLWWWVGDVVGALIVAPALLTLQAGVFSRFHERYHAAEFILLCLATIAVSGLVFFSGNGQAVAFIALPLLLWAALRFGTWVSSLTVVLIAIIGAGGALSAHRSGHGSSPDSASLLTAFLATAALLNLLLSALLGERRRAEVALRDGLERLHRSLTHAKMVTCEVDLDAGGMIWGAQADDLFGAEPTAVPSTLEGFFGRVHPDDRAPLHGAMAKGLAGIPPLSYALEYRILRLDGSLRWVASVGEFQRDANGRVAHASGVSYDITGRRQAEQALRESEMRHRTLVEHSPEAILVFDVELGHFIDANPRACQLFALGMPGLLAADPAILSPPLQPDGMASGVASRKQNERAIAGELPQFEWRFRNAHGAEFTCEVLLVRLPSSTGRTLIRGTIVDVSERKQAQAALRASDERLRLAFAAAGLGAWELDLVGGALTWSPECAQLHHLRPGQAPRTLAEFYAMVADQERPALQEAITGAITSGRLMQCEYRTRDAEGGERWFAAYARSSADAQGGASRMIGVVMDISARHLADQARQRLEAQLFQSHKLEAIGTLAGGIAHDFNNILAAIIGNLELARQDLVIDRPVQPRLDNILAASHRARDLVRQILAFSRQQESVRSVQRMEPLVEEVAALLRASLPATVAMEVQIAPGCPPVRVDPSQMHQVLLNLCTNAWQALPAQRGRLTITVAAVELDALAVKTLPGLAVGPHLRLSVSDNGSGIDPGTQARIFEPFFTTKATGQGTGLGLAVVHGIVQAHDGAIVVESRLGAGTTFQVFLPAAVAAPSVDADSEPPQHGQGEHIVFIDDEPSLVQLGEDMLSDLGYRVTGFTDPQAALAAIREHLAEVDLVVSDLTMPAMSGLELACTLLAIRPDLPIIIATGYSGALTPEQVHAAGIRALLIKPAVLESLAAAVHQHVRRPAPTG